MKRALATIESLEHRHLLTITAVNWLPDHIGNSVTEVATTDSVAMVRVHGADASDVVWLTDGSGETRQILETSPQGVTASGERIFYLDERSLVVVSDGFDPVVVAEDLWFVSDIVAHLDGVAFLVGQDRTAQVWTSDGTPEGTKPVEGATFESFNPTLVSVDDTLFIVNLFEQQILRADANSGMELVREFSQPISTYAVLGNDLWITVDTNHGSQLWRTNGDADLALVRSFSKERVSLNDASQIGSDVYFPLTSNPMTYQGELWKTDGTKAGTVRVEQILEGTIVSTASGNSGLVYVQLAEDGNYDLWELSSESESPQQLHEFSRIVPRNEHSLTAIDSEIYFVDGADLPGESQTLYSYEGEAGVRVVETFDAGILSSPIDVGDHVLVLAKDGEEFGLWSESKNIDDAAELIAPTAEVARPTRITGMFVHDDVLLFSTSTFDDYGSSRLWVRDATGEMTAIVDARLGPDAHTSLLRSSATYSDHTIFWNSDGTREGTEPVYATATADQVISNGEIVFFTQDSNGIGLELWARNNEDAWLVKDILPGPSGSSPSDFTLFDDVLYFKAADEIAQIRVGNTTRAEVANFELWRSDGTREGTNQVINISDDVDAPPTSSSSSDPQWITPVGNGIYFFTRKVGDFSLWWSDGTEAGTQKILEGIKQPQEVYAFGNRILFRVNIFDPNVTGVWISDGTAEGTYQTENFPVAKHIQHVEADGNGNARVILTASSRARFEDDYFLWTSDGVHDGTEETSLRPPVVREVLPWPTEVEGVTTAATVVDPNRFVFTGQQGPTNFGSELGVIEFPLANFIYDIVPGRQSSSPSNLVSWNDEVYFTTLNDGEQKIWTTADVHLPGDFNRDGQVGFDDFLQLSANFGKSDADLGDGDLTDDRQVNFEDFLIFSANFGEKLETVERIQVFDLF